MGGSVLGKWGWMGPREAVEGAMKKEALRKIEGCQRGMVGKGWGRECRREKEIRKPHKCRMEYANVRLILCRL